MPEPAASAQDVLLEQVALLLEPLTALATPAGAAALVRDLGWNVAATAGLPGVPADLGGKVTKVLAALARLQGASTDAERFDEGLKLLEDARALLAMLPALGGQIQAALPAADPLQQVSGMAGELFRRLADSLVARRLRRASPAAYDLALLLGLASKRRLDPIANPQDLDVAIDRIEWERLPVLFSDPLAIADAVYGWSSAFDAELFLSRLFSLLTRLGLHTDIREQNEQIGDALNRPIEERHEYRVALVSAVSAGAYSEAGLRFSAAPGAGEFGPGLAVMPYATGSAGATEELAPGLQVSIAATLGVSGGVAFVLRPPHRVSVGVNLLGAPTGDVSGGLTAALTGRAQEGGVVRLLGSPDGTRLTAQELTVGVIAKAEGTEDREVAFVFDVKELSLVVAPGDGDGFLQKVLPPDGLRAAADLALSLSTKTGLRFKGSGGLAVDLPVHVTLGGVFRIDAVHLGLGAKDRALGATVGVTGGLELGPLSATIERVGVSADVAVPASGAGNLGPLDVQLRFAPPKGVGLVIESGPVSGGGYLFFDPDEQQYAGALQLDLQALSLKAVGLLTTRMPDGSDGFSLLVIITADFSPIQLSFGFTLNGVGGLVGINRGVDLGAMRAGLKSGALDSVRFPKDVVKNAPRIVSDLRAIFPVTPGQYVFGPMVALGWGTPTLLRLELGLLLELPSPLRLFILGKLVAALPKPDQALVVLQLDALGVVDFDRRAAELDGTLRDSRIVEFPLSGDLALRTSWGPSPAFAFSAGGFHPRFAPPPGFPALQRTTIALADGDNPRLVLQAYLAVTSNSIQTGAALDVFVEKDLGWLGRFTLQAGVHFDALIRFVPFEFVVDLGGGFTLKRNGKSFCSVRLELTLSGPRPFLAAGTATFEALGLERSIHVEVSVGPPAAPEPLEPLDPQPALLAQLADPASWTAELPGDARMMVTLRRPAPGDRVALVHPLGELTVRQRVVPLDLPIETYGHHPLAAGALRTYSLVVSDAATGTPLPGGPVEDAIAAGEFFQLTDDQKLSRPAFERFASGRRVGAPGMSPGATRARPRGYKTVIVEPDRPAVSQPGYAVSADLLGHLARGGAAGRSALRTRGELAYRGPAREGLRVSDARYRVVRGRDLSPADDAGATTYTEAELRRRGASKAARGDDGDLLVVTSHEVPE